MEMQKSVIFVIKELKINIYKKKKKYCKIRGYCCQTEEYRVVAHSICNLKKSA